MLGIVESRAEQRHEPVAVAVRQRLQHHRVDHAVDRRRRSDADRERRGREQRRPPWRSATTATPASRHASCARAAAFRASHDEAPCRRSARLSAEWPDGEPRHRVRPRRWFRSVRDRDGRRARRRSPDRASLRRKTADQPGQRFLQAPHHRAVLPSGVASTRPMTDASRAQLAASAASAFSPARVRE